MIENLYLIDHDAELVDAWREAFQAYPEVHPICGDYFQRDADLMVSPANSFGFMDGGLDYAIREKLGVHVEEMLQAEISNQYHGELPIGHCLVVKTGHSQWPYLASIQRCVYHQLFRVLSMCIMRFGLCFWSPHMERSHNSVP